MAGFLAVVNGKTVEQYVGMWVAPQNDEEDSRIYVGVTHERHQEANDELENANYKFKHGLQEYRGLDGQQKYCGVRTKASVGDWWWWYNTPFAEIDQKRYVDTVYWDIDLSEVTVPETTKQRYEKLLADAQVRLRQRPGDLNARSDRAMAYFYLGRNSDTLTDIGYVIQQANTVAGPYQYRSILYARLGDEKAARFDLQHLAKRSTSERFTIISTALTLASLSDEAEAVNRLEELVDQNREDSTTLYEAACAMSLIAGVYRNRNNEKADRYADRSVELLMQAIATGFTHEHLLFESEELDPIRQHSGFNELLKQAKTRERFAAVWNASAKKESQASFGLEPAAHLDQCREWDEQCFRPVTVSATSIQGEVVTASVWHRPKITQGARVRFAKRQANAAAALARLSQTDKLFPVLRVRDDPESLTQFVHRFRQEGGTPRQLLICLKRADRGRQAIRGDARKVEDRVLFGLLLALGEYRLDELPSEKQQDTVEQVSRWYEEDESSTIHGAAGWLLRRWGQFDQLQKVDRSIREYVPGREWFTRAIEAEGQIFHQTYVVIQPGEYIIGSPLNEPNRSSDERLNRVRLTRPVAILDREISQGEFEASGILDELNISQRSVNLENPMIGTSWYNSVRFCRWLTERAGLDQAYADPSTLNATQFPLDGVAFFPKHWPLNENALGFRLPTEAEWEIAARAGTKTMFSFGADETLLDNYAWNLANAGSLLHVSKDLRPNLAGLFSIHGNVLEWCHDWYGDYPRGSVRNDPVGETTSGRVVRGGSIFTPAHGCRSASRLTTLPAVPADNMGFRVAAFLPSQTIEENAGEANRQSKQTDRLKPEP